MTTPNMGLTLPTPGEGGTPGPEWASTINSDLELIDAHDHAGTGVQIPTAGIGIDADLSFNDRDATSLRAVRFTSQVGDPAQNALVFVKNGELTYKDSSGNVVPITAGGSVAGATGSISGLTAPASAVYSSITKSFTWLFDSAKAARMANADILLYPYDGSTAFANSITIKAPTALAAAYSLTLPLALPANDSILGLSSAGVLSAGAPDGSAANPGIPFSSDLDTGLYRIGANSLGLTLGGTQRADFSIGNLVFKPDGSEAGRFTAGQLQMVDGTVAAPSWSYSSDPDTGFYRITGNAVGLSLGGTQRIDFSVNAFVFKPDGNEALRFTPGQIQTVDGSASAPTYAFGNNANMGMYRAGSNTLAFSTGGVIRNTITSAGFDFYEAGVSQGQFKVKLFTGTLTAGATTTLTGPGTTIYGVVGTRGNFAPILYETGTSVEFFNGVTTNQIRVRNNLGASQDYRVVMYYQ